METYLKERELRTKKRNGKDGKHKGKTRNHSSRMHTDYLLTRRWSCSVGGGGGLLSGGAVQGVGTVHNRKRHHNTPSPCEQND